MALYAPESYRDARADASLHILMTMRRFVEEAVQAGDIEDPGPNFIFKLSPGIQKLLGLVDDYAAF